MIKKCKKPISILLSILMVVSVFIAVPMTASALEGYDVQSLLSSMSAMIDGYIDQGDWDHADPLIEYYNSLGEAFYEANGQVTAEVESAYNAAYTYFTDNGGTVSGGQGGSGSGGTFPAVNNVYRATDDPVHVTISDLQPGDVIVASSSAPMEVQKGNCNIVLIGGTYGEGDSLEGTLFQTFPNNVTLGSEIRFNFSENYPCINDEDSHGHYLPVYNNTVGNAYIVLGNDNGTVYLAGYNFTTYTITWKDYNGSNLYDGQSTVGAGTVPYYRWSVSRASTAQYSYTFTGWTDSSNTFYPKDSDLPAATKDETYTATYSETLRSYTITWKDGDNKTLKSESVAYGTTPSYTGATPTKTEDNGYTYEFNGTWSPSVASVTGNATYTAQFTAVPRIYTITWKNDDGTVIDTATAAYGDTPTHPDATKEDDAQFTYNFIGWDPVPAAVTGDAEYTAQFDTTVNEYTITWKNDDGTVIDTTTVAYGDTPTHPDATKEDDAQFTYNFIGWDPVPTAVTGDAEYTAVFNAEAIAHQAVITDGKYYVDGELVKGAGLVEVDGDIYFVKQNGAVYKDATLFVAEAKTNGLASAGKYAFDEDGKMIRTAPKNGIVDGRYYVNDELVKGAGLVEFDGDIYFVKQNGSVYMNGSLVVSEAKANGLAPAGTYDFDADGKMIIKNGVIKGYYYENNVLVKGKGLVLYNDKVYFVKQNGAIYKDGTLFVSGSKTNGILEAGLHTFDADGVTATILVC